MTELEKSNLRYVREQCPLLTIEYTHGDVKSRPWRLIGKRGADVMINVHGKKLPLVKDEFISTYEKLKRLGMLKGTNGQTENPAHASN